MELQKSAIFSCNDCKVTSLINYECVKCGKLKCHKCITNKICKSCKTNNDYKRSYLADRLIGKLQTTCLFCSLSFTHNEIYEHKATCSLWKFSCNIKNCNFSGIRLDFLKHCEATHEGLLTKLFDSRTSTEKKWKSNMKSEDDYPRLEDLNISDNKNTNDKNCIVY